MGEVVHRPENSPGAEVKYNGWPGARDFRDFSRLPPAQENRGQPADPAPADINETGPKGVLDGDRYDTE
jgi:hypothetical protein